MKYTKRKIDLQKDKDYILESHCRVNYECDSPWKRKMTYAEYRDEWFGMTKQVSGFLSYLQETMEDERTIAEIIETENGERIGYFWAPFIGGDKENGVRFAEIQDVYIEEAFQRQGIAGDLFACFEEKARENGAKVIRSGTGCENVKSIALHEKMGYYQYRYEFEKLL